MQWMEGESKVVDDGKNEHRSTKNEENDGFWRENFRIFQDRHWNDKANILCQHVKDENKLDVALAEPVIDEDHV